MKNAEIRKIDDLIWICCPYCGKKAMRITGLTRCEYLPYVCKGSDCRKEYMIFVPEGQPDNI